MAPQQHRWSAAALLVALALAVDLVLVLVVVGVVRDRGGGDGPARRLTAQVVAGAVPADVVAVEGRLVGADALGDPGSGRLPDVSAFHRAGISGLTLDGDRLDVRFLAGSTAAERDRARRVLLRSPVLTAVADEQESAGAWVPAIRDTTGAAAAMRAAVADGTVPGVVAMVSERDRVWASGVGAADTGTDAPMSPALQLRVGSTTKTLTAVLVLRLCEQGRCSLDDPVAEHLPGVLPYARPVTIRQLLGHTSGLVDASHFGRRSVVPARDVPRVADPRLRAEAEAALAAARRGEPVVVPPAVQVAVATTRPLAFAPGSRFAYSNTDYLVLSMLVERLTDRPLAAVMEREIFAPLHMRDSFLATGPAFTGPHARSYTRGSGGQPVDATDDLAFGASGSGAVVSTAADITTFFRALMAGRLLPARLVDEMATPTPRSAMGGAMTAYGLGLTRYATPCGRPVWGHGGVIGGYVSSVYAARDGGAVAVFLGNGDGGVAVRDEVAGELFCAATGGDGGD